MKIDIITIMFGKLTEYNFPENKIVNNLKDEIRSAIAWKKCLRLT